MTSTTATESANSTADQQQQPNSPTTDPPQTATDEQQQEQTTETNAEASSPKKSVAPKPTVHKVDYEKDVVYLYQFSRCPTLPSASPFCLKVENWLRMNGVGYEVSE